MKVLLEKLNKKFVYVSTMVVVLIVLICHVFMLEEKKDVVEVEEKKDRKIEKEEKKSVGEVVDLGNSYIEINITGNGKADISINPSSVGTVGTIKSTGDNQKNIEITFTNVQFKTTAQYGIKINNTFSTAGTSGINLKFVGENIIQVNNNSNSNNGNVYGIYYSASTGLDIDLAGDNNSSLDIDVNQEEGYPGNGYGIYSQNQTDISIDLGELDIDSTNQGIYAGESGNCTINGGTADINDTKVESGTSLNSTELGKLTPSSWPSSYSLKFHVENNTGTLYAVESGGTETNVMGDLPNGEDGKIEIDGSTLKLIDYQFDAPSGFAKALEITGSGNATIDISGINKIGCLSGAAITVASSINLNITGTSTDSLDIQGTTYAIGGSGNITISRGIVNATATGAAGRAILGNNVTISGGIVTTNSEGSGNRATIFATDTATVSGGKVIATVTSSDSSACGIYGANSVVIEGGETSITDTKENAVSQTSPNAAIYSDSSVYIYGGTVGINIAGLDTRAIQAPSNLLVGRINEKPLGNADVTIKGKIYSLTNYQGTAVFAGQCNINEGGTLDIDVANTTDTSYITGLIASRLQQNGGTLDVNVDVKNPSTNAYGESDGILVNQELIVNGGTLISKTNGQANNNPSGIHVIGSATIENVNASIETKVQVENTNPNASSGRGLFIDGNLNITGGTCTAEGAFSGIYIANNNMTITGGEVTATTTAANSKGIEVSGNKIEIGTISGGNTSPKVTVNIKDSDGSSDGIHASGDIVIKSGTVTVGDETKKNYSVGISAGGNLDIKGGVVNSTALTKGFYVGNDLAISGGTVTTSSISSTNACHGIYVVKDASITGGTATITSAASSQTCYVMKVDGALEVEAGTVDINAYGSNTAGLEANSITIGRENGGIDSPIVNIKRYDGDSTNQNTDEAIYTPNSVSVYSGTLTIGGGNSNYAVGIRSGGNIEIKGGKVDVTANIKGIEVIYGILTIDNVGEDIALPEVKVLINNVDNTDAEKVGIYSPGNMTINSGTVTSVVNATTGLCYGIKGDNKVTISDGSVYATVKAYTATGIQVGSNGMVIGDSSDSSKCPKIEVNRDASNNQESQNDGYVIKNDGISSDGEIVVYNGDIDIIGKFANGIEAYGTLDIKAGDIDSYGTYKGVWVEQGLIISGGDVAAVGGTDSSGWNAGLFVRTKDLTISGGTVYTEATGYQDARGIVASNGSSINILGGTFTAIGKNTSSQGILIDNGKLNITGGTVITKGQGNSSKGIALTTGIVDIDDGKVEVSATGGNYTKGINNENGSIDISGGEVIVDVNGTEAYGIHNKNNQLGLANATIRVTSSGQGARGIINEYNSSTALNVYSGNIYVNIYGLYSKGLQTTGGFTIGEKVGDAGPTIVVRGDISNHNNNYDECAFYAGGDMTINAGYLNVDLQSTDNSASNYGITGMRVVGGLTINGGNLEVNTNVLRTDGTYGMTDGINVTGAVKIAGGRVICTTNGASVGDTGAHIGSTLTIIGGNSQFKNTNEANGSSYGVVVGGAVSVTGGYAIMQGKNYAISSTSVSYTGTTDQEGKSIMARASEDYNGIGLEIYESTKNNTYDYVEFGVIYSHYLNFSNGVFYRGDSQTTFTAEELTRLGIALDMTNGAKITFTNTKFTSNTKYGLYANGDVTIVLTDKSVNQIESIGAATDTTYGAIYVNGKLTIEGKGELVVKGNSQGIKANSVSFIGDTESEPAVKEASESYDATNVETYPTISNWAKYKYLKIALLEDYYFKYDATNKLMYCVYVNQDGSDKTSKRLTYNNELKIGWEIKHDETYGDVLELNDFDMTTRTPYGLRIIGDCVVKLIDNNTILTIDNKYNNYVGLSAEGSITMIGEGSIETIRGNNAANHIGINSSGNMIINGGTYIVDNVATGIQCGGDLSITNSTCELLANQYGIKMTGSNKLTIKNSSLEVIGKARAIDLVASTQSDIYESVWASTAENGDESTEISDINTRVRNSGTGNNNLSTFKYVKMDTPIFSVDITWGALEYKCEGHWNPSTHAYEDEWIVDTDNHADMIRVENRVDSNASVKATISHNIDEEEKGIGVTFVTDRSLEDQLATDTNSVEHVLVTATGLLERFLVLSGLPKNNYATPTSVGSVTVTLEDNID